MSGVSSAAGRVAHGLIVGSCASGRQHVLQRSVLLWLSVRQHAIQGYLNESCSHSSQCTARQGRTPWLTGCGMLTWRGWSTAEIGRASALCRQPLDVFKRPAEPRRGMTTLLEALECLTVQGVEADRNWRQ